MKPTTALSVAQLRALSEPEGFAFLDTGGNQWNDFVRFTRREER